MLRCVLSAVLCSSLCGGCAMLHPRPKLDARVGLFDAASLSYELDAARLNLPLAVSRIEGQLVSYDQVASGPLPERATGTLKIVYPHPDGRSDMAEARVIISNGQSPGESKRRWWQPRPPKDVLHVVPPAKSYEEWALDLPKSEIDQLFERLRGRNYFQGEALSGTTGKNETVQINTRLDGRELRKSWPQVPELEALMQRVRGQGQLVAYRRESSGPAQGYKLTSSAATYQQLVAQDNAPSGSAVLANNSAGSTATGLASGSVLGTGLPANIAVTSGLDMPKGRWTAPPAGDAANIANRPGERLK